MWGLPAVYRATERASGVAGQRAKRALYAVQSGVEKAGSAVKGRLGHEDQPTERTTELLAAEESSGALPGTTPRDATDAWSP